MSVYVCAYVYMCVCVCVLCVLCVCVVWVVCVVCVCIVCVVCVVCVCVVCVVCVFLLLRLFVLDQYSTGHIVTGKPSEFKFPFPYLYDESQEVAKAYGAVCTPDFFGFNNKMELQYRGRFDSQGRELTPKLDAKRDLLDAMTLVAKTGQGPKEQIPSIGCSIKWKEQSGSWRVEQPFVG